MFRAMALSRDQIVFMGLVALDEAMEQQRQGEYDPPFALRVVIAMLHAITGGPAEPFADFWHGCCQPITYLSSGYVSEGERTQKTSTAWHGICQALRVAETINFGSDIAAARRDPGPHQEAYSALRRSGQEPEEAARQAFARRLLETGLQARRAAITPHASETPARAPTSDPPDTAAAGSAHPRSCRSATDPIPPPAGS